MPTLRDMQEAAGAEYIAFGPSEIVSTFGPYEVEYAAIRRRVGIMHRPQRGLLRLVGADVKDFLHRLLTQQINEMQGGDSRRAFMLNVKGRTIADMIVHHGDVDTWLDTDAVDIDELAKALDMRLFTEDVTIQDITGEWTSLSLHGPATVQLLEALGGRDVDPPHAHHVMELAGANVTVYRRDVCGVPGYEVWCKSGDAPTLYAAMWEAAGFDPDAPDPEADPQAAADATMQRRESLRGRPVGWLAFNTARIEAGAPVYHVDFGADCLPHESGVLHDAVSFTKGCYVGQEIVARMDALGHPKRMIAGLRLEGDRLPIAGSQVFDPEDHATIIGAVTSSTLSPLRGNTAIALVMMKWGKHEAGSNVAVAAEGGLVDAVVCDLSGFAP